MILLIRQSQQLGAGEEIDRAAQFQRFPIAGGGDFVTAVFQVPGVPLTFFVVPASLSTELTKEELPLENTPIMTTIKDAAKRTGLSYYCIRRLCLTNQSSYIKSGAKHYINFAKNSDRVFTSADGSPMYPDVLSGWFHDIIRTTDLPPIHLHSLRHTNATLAIANGVAVTTVAGQLGHATPATTMKIYAHAIQSAQAAAADVMDDLLTRPRPRRGRSKSRAR